MGTVELFVVIVAAFFAHDALRWWGTKKKRKMQWAIDFKHPPVRLNRAVYNVADILSR